MIKPYKLYPGDTIGLISPCYTANQPDIERATTAINALGYSVKCADNILKDTYEFSATIQERVDDIHQMFLDDTVKMIIFEGGEVSNELLPYLDYNLIKSHPKIVSSFSDGTSILNAISARADMVTYYGQSPATLFLENTYNHSIFRECFMENSYDYHQSAPWEIVCSGIGTGELIGGYLVNFALMIGTKYLPIHEKKDYILLIEDHEAFNTPSAVSRYVSHIDQSGLLAQTKAILIGNYAPSDKPYPIISDIFRRMGEKYHIPVVRCDDFGHGGNNAVLPIGVTATLNTKTQSLHFEENILKNR